MNKILLIGGGGHCKSVADAAIMMHEYEQIGIVVNSESATIMDNISIVGDDDDLLKLYSEGWNCAFVAVGSVGDTSLRQKLYSNICSFNYRIPNIIDPSAVVSKNSKLDSGIFVGKNAVINAGSSIGTAAIINTGAIVEHDCIIGAFGHISPGATICGGVEIGEGSHIGARSVIIQKIKVGRNVVIGAGTVVIHDVPDGCTVVGNPGRIIKR